MESLSIQFHLTNMKNVLINALFSENKALHHVSTATKVIHYLKQSKTDTRLIIYRSGSGK